MVGTSLLNDDHPPKFWGIILIILPFTVDGTCNFVLTSSKQAVHRLSLGYYNLTFEITGNRDNILSFVNPICVEFYNIHMSSFFFHHSHLQHI